MGELFISNRKENENKRVLLGLEDTSGRTQIRPQLSKEEKMAVVGKTRLEIGYLRLRDRSPLTFQSLLSA